MLLLLFRYAGVFKLRGITTSCKRLQKGLEPGSPPQAQTGPDPPNRLYATVSFRSASVLARFLAPGHFGVLGPWSWTGRAPLHESCNATFTRLELGFTRQALHDCVKLPLLFRCSSVTLPLCG